MSLKQLQLSPSGTIIIFSEGPPTSPAANNGGQNSTSNSWLGNCLSYVGSFLWPVGGATQDEQTPPNQPSTVPTAQAESQTVPPSRGTSGITQRRGNNVARLSEFSKEEDDEDRNAYWNGNSTQQQ